MTEADLLRKLAAIEALVHRAGTEGEQAAAASAKLRIEARLQQTEAAQDFYFTIQDVWAQKLFIALAQRAGLRPFRFKGQRRTSLVIHTTTAPKDALWKSFLEADQILRTYLDEVTSRVISQALGGSLTPVAEHPASAPQQLNLVREA